MAQTVHSISDIPDRRKFDGRWYTHYEQSWGRGAKQRMKRRGKALKQQGRITNYRTQPYKDVEVAVQRGGRIEYEYRNVYALFVRR